MYTFEEVGNGFIHCFRFSKEFSLRKTTIVPPKPLRTSEPSVVNGFLFPSPHSQKCLLLQMSLLRSVFASVERVPGKNLATGTTACDLPARQCSTPDARAGGECMVKGTELC